MSQESSNDKKPTIPPYMKAISGSLGGVVEASCLQPIDVIKTRLQLDRSGNYKGIIHCGSTIVRTEGVRALWKGLTPFATHLTLKYTLRMGSNAVFQSAFKDSETGKVSNRGRLMSGFGAGVLEALAIVTPFEVSECLFVFFFLVGTVIFDVQGMFLVLESDCSSENLLLRMILFRYLCVIF